MFETFEECAAREVHEEMGLQLDPESICQVYVSNDVFPEEKKHYVTIAMMARISPTDILMNRRPENLEPDKCLGWKSYSWDELTDIFNGTDMILFPSLATLVKARPPVIMNILTSTTHCPEVTK
jgi:ADP-ribose pyrophosphatase YjhB (NUDIX family)